VSERPAIAAAIELVSAGATLPAELAAAALEEMVAGSAEPVQVAALLAMLRLRGETSEELAAFAGVMRNNAVHVNAPEDAIDLAGSPQLETTCFRIVQEGVTNVIRHARANRISVRLERTGADLMLVIADDGSGFNVKTTLADGHMAATLGLRGMEERAQAVGGTLLIDSAPGLGTQVCVSLPVALDKLGVRRLRAIDVVKV